MTGNGMTIAELLGRDERVDLALRERALVLSNVTIEVRDSRTRRLKRRIRRHNLVVDAGLNMIRDLLADEDVGFLQYFGVGTGSTAAAAGQTAMAAEVYRAQVTLFERTAKRLTVKFFLGSTAANGSSLREGAIFNAASAGTMFARFVHSAIAKTGSNTVTYIWDFDFSAS